MSKADEIMQAVTEADAYPYYVLYRKPKAERWKCVGAHTVNEARQVARAGITDGLQTLLVKTLYGMIA